MKMTRANVEEYANKQGLETVICDGIPEGFIWKEPSVMIGDKLVKGRFALFAPKKEWNITYVPFASNPSEILEVYNHITK